MPTPFDQLPFQERPDLSPYLVHLTKRRGRRSGFQNLVKILKEGTLVGSGNDGYIKGPNPAVCFMDIPFMALKYLLNDKNCRRDPPRYEPYGVFITKKTAYDKGLRPVLYLSDGEIDDLEIPENELWRVVELDANDDGWVSWLHEREWRVKGNLRLPTGPIGVLVQYPSEVAELNRLLNDEDVEFHARPKVILPLVVVCQGMIYLTPEN